MKRPKYKEMYELERASHYATEEELKKFKRKYSELALKITDMEKAYQNKIDDANFLKELIKRVQIGTTDYATRLTIERAILRREGGL